MTATSVLLILVGIFVIINAPNLVGVIKGDKKLTPFTSGSTTPTTSSTNTGTTDPRAGK